MSSFGKILLFLFCFGISPVLKAQYCEWLNTGAEITAADIYSDDSGNAVLIGRIVTNTTLSGIALTANSFNNSFLAKYDSAGQLIWVIQTTATSTSGLNTSDFNQITGDQNCNYFITGISYGSISFGNGVALSAASGQMRRFVLKVNSAGVPQWVRTISSSISVGLVGVAADDAGQVYLSCSFNGTLSVAGTTTTYSSVNNSTDLAVIKYSSQGNLVWVEQFGGGGNQSTFRTIALDADRNIYLKLFNTGSWSFGGIQIQQDGLLILKVNQHGVPINAKSIKTGNMGGGFLSAYPDGRFVIVGNFNDSLHLSPSIKLHHTGAAAYSSYVAFFDSSLECKWGMQTQALSTGLFSFIANPAMHENGMYLGGRVYQGDVMFGSTQIPTYGGNVHTAVMAKVDTLGNILWCFSTGCSTCYANTMGASASPNGDGYFCGYWADSISVFNRQAASNVNWNAFAAKIIDYSIERGPVSSGPYCAGDSIRIPFTKRGEYNSGNEFIAELSDSAGNFDSNYRELGRITGTGDGEIKGVLPLFNVSTSGDYRIRIISTSPVVQSYYLKDTLRLLIYSKDTANAGEDLTICKGQTAKLNTSGGSKWQWTPTHDFVDEADSAKAAGFVQPDTTREYRIIISDSSGCGVTDTDFVRVLVRPPLEVTVPEVVNFCILRPAVITAQGAGGDTTNYHFSWRMEGDATYSILSDENTLTVSPFSTRRYWVRLTDSCTSLSDSAMVRVVPSSGVTLEDIPDTTICSGQNIEVEVRSTACDSSAIRYYWNNGLGTGTLKTLSPQATTTYTVIARDTVDGRTDTVHFTVTVHQPLEVSLGNDTTLCDGQMFTLTPQASGGTGIYQYVWKADTGTGFYEVASTSSISIQAYRTIGYQVHISDHCSTPSDSDQISLAVLSPLEILPMQDTLVCKGEELNLWAGTTGGLTTAHELSWYDESGILIQTGQSISIQPILSNTYMAVLRDYCTLEPDTALVRIDVRDGLSIAPVTDTAICYGNTVLINPLLSGGLAGSYKLYLQSAEQVNLDSGFSFLLDPQITTSYRLALGDQCSADSAFAVFRIEVSEPLQASLEMADSICAGASLLLKATVSGGLASSQSLSWYRNDTLQSATALQWSDQPLASAWYVLRLEDGCSETIYDSAFVEVLPEPVARFSISDTVGCSPLEVFLRDESENHDPAQNLWEVSSLNFNTGESAPVLVQPGSYDVSLQVFNVLGCRNQSIQKKKIQVYPKPRAGFEVRPPARQTEEVLKFINTGFGASLYYWDLGDGNELISAADTLFYSYADSGYYEVTQIAVNPYGCSDTAQYGMRVYLTPLCAIPNAFSPSGDRLNESFAPVCSGIDTYKMTILNRWGQILLECEDCSWDGTYEGVPVPAGVYYYRIDTFSPLSERSFVAGMVTVIR